MGLPRARAPLARAAFVLALLAALLPASAARAAASIEFLNPSGYTATSTTLQLSDKADTDNAYHLVAWVQQVPANPVVEFEIQPTGQNAETLTAQRVGSSDAWEAFFEIPTTDTDGPYTLRAILYSNGTEVDNAEKTVTINASDVPPPPAAETLEMTYPANGGGLGFFTPKGKPTNTVISFTTSKGANGQGAPQQARVFYTQSDPGNAPEWKLCGFGSVNQTTFSGRAKCELKSGDSPDSVTAVAAVANRTPSRTDPQPGLDETGDAHRVEPYIQVPSSFTVTPQAQSVNPEDCTTPPISAVLKDQLGQPIAGANVDVHAVGPNDQLRFGTMGTTTSGFQPPDKNHLSKELAWDCTNDQSSSSDNQGDHNVPGGSDIKHIESTTGTGTAGQFVFALRADSVGGTSFTLWADVDDDDLPGASEASGGGRIGWGQPPPPPVEQITITPTSSSPSQNDCQTLTLTATEDGTPISGRNVDLHVTGPTSGTAFCDAGNGVPRPPDQGGHTGYTHPDGTLHGEGETDASGHFVVGVTSNATGASTLAAWIDRTDDDLQGTDEPSASGSMDWKPPGHRSITISSNKSPVPKGSKVTLSGRVKGDDQCLDAQTVKIKSRRHGGRKFRNAGQTSTSSNGHYSIKETVRRTTDYRAVVPKSGSCSSAKSRTITVRVT